MIESIEDVLEKSETQPLTCYTEFLTNWYIDISTPEYRKKKGQFFTPRKTSEFMIRQFTGLNKEETIRILDPGAGMGIFESTICEFLLSAERTSKISFDLYENDENIIPLLKHNMGICRILMAKEGFKMTYKIHETDFILSNSPIFNDESNNFDCNRDGYDIVISNPPYYKLKKESPQAIEMQSIIKGQPNIYTLFMALSAKLLKNGGQITVLTPRSYFSGVYFENFRKWFFKNIKPVRIHVFESRRKVFGKYNVLQEMVILTAMKNSKTPKKIIVSTSNGEPDEKDDLLIRKADYDKIIVENDSDITVRIPTSELDESIAAHIDKLGFKLGDLDLKISTGPVVPFRARKHLLISTDKKQNFAPLIWMQNIKDGKVSWPIQRNSKPIAIKNDEESKKLLISRGNYVLIKRLSTKEGKQRINAGVLLENYLTSDYIGIENHVNYVYKVNGSLTEDEAYGIIALLNSRLYNRYFQMTNGSTQVNATDISNIPLPSLEKIRLIGSLVRKKKENSEIENEKIIAKELNLGEKIIIDLVAEQ